MCFSDVMHEELSDKSEDASVNGTERSSSERPLAGTVVREHRVGVLL